MPLESASYISQLVASNPTATDSVSQGDDHLRLIKLVLQSQFPNFTAAPLSSTNAQVDGAVNTLNGTGNPALLQDGNQTNPSYSWKNETNSGIYRNASGLFSASVLGSNIWYWSSSGIGLQPGKSLYGANGSPYAQVPLATIVLFAGNTLPTPDAAQWWWCNGAAISRTTYSALFTAIGTNYGIGDGSTTFNLPDLREVVPMGLAGMGGTGSRGLMTDFSGSGWSTSGAVFGEQHHTLTTNEMPSHSHPGTTATSNVTDPGHSHSIPFTGTLHNPSGGVTSGTEYYVAGSGQSTGSTTTGITVGTTVNMAAQGGGAVHNNVQPTTVYNYIIRIF